MSNLTASPCAVYARVVCLNAVNASRAYNLTITPEKPMGVLFETLSNIKSEENALVAIEISTLLLVAVCLFCLGVIIYYGRGYINRPVVFAPVRRSALQSVRSRA